MSYTCPNCNATSYNPTDEAERYCGNCHRYADELQSAEQQARRQELLELHAQRMASRDGADKESQ